MILISFGWLGVSCTGRSDRDGDRSIEGSADPSNNGGKLSGDHFVKKPEVRDTVIRKE
jgi:hypothetical protein